MDALERQHLRKKMALKMEVFQGKSRDVACVSAHWVSPAQVCDLCERVHAEEVLVIKNRKGQNLKVDGKCLTEMVRFQVTDVADLPKWFEKIGALKAEQQRRAEEARKLQEEERKKLERKVIVRRRPGENSGTDGTEPS